MNGCIGCDFLNNERLLRISLILREERMITSIMRNDFSSFWKVWRNMNMDRHNSLRESASGKSKPGDICEGFKEVFAKSVHYSRGKANIRHKFESKYNE